jgi:hypothetical protein
MTLDSFLVLIRQYLSNGKVGRGLSVDILNHQIVFTYTSKMAGKWTGWYTTSNKHLKWTINNKQYGWLIL